jgi:hypothetical protein
MSGKGVWTLSCSVEVAGETTALKEGRMKAYAVMLLVVLVPSVAAAFDSIGVSKMCAAAANVFFLVAPVIFAVGSFIGLLYHRRA